MTATDQTIDTCNSLLRGEISAVETYTQAIEKFDITGSDTVLERIRVDHQQNVFELQNLVRESGGAPATTSGAWGGFVQAIEGSASLLGESPALKILQTGEEHGISQYENALANEEVSADAKTLIRKALLPSLSGHLIELQQRRDRAA